MGRSPESRVISMQAAIAALRSRVGRERPIFVCHTDLPANDFSEMFALLESNPQSYLLCDRSVVLSEPLPRQRHRNSIRDRRDRACGTRTNAPLWSWVCANEIFFLLMAQPDSPADFRPLLHPLQQRRRPGRVRSPSCAGLGSVPVAAGRRVARVRSSGCRASSARSRRSNWVNRCLTSSRESKSPRRSWPASRSSQGRSAACCRSERRLMRVCTTSWFSA